MLSPDIARRTLIKEVLTPLSERFPTPEGGTGFGDGRLHSFRHYFCSTCANTGVPEQVVMQWLGHRDSQMVRHYYHLHDDEAQRQMQRSHFRGRVRRHVGVGRHHRSLIEEVTEVEPKTARYTCGLPVTTSGATARLVAVGESARECKRPGLAQLWHS